MKQKYLNPENQRIQLRIANCYMSLGDINNSFKFYREAVEKSPSDFFTNFNMGNYFYQTNDYESAQHYLNISLEITPKHPTSLEVIYKVYFHLKKWEKSIECLKELIRRDRHNPELYYNLGIAMEKIASKKEDYEDIIKTLMRGINLDKGNEAIRLRCEDIAVRSRMLNPDHYLRKKISLQNEKYGDYYYERNYIDKAKYYYKRGIRLFPTNVKLILKLAKIYKSERYIQRYLNELKRVFEFAPQDENLKQDINYYDRVCYRLFSKANGIEQYKLNNVSPKIIVGSFIRKDDLETPFEVEKSIQDMFYTCLYNKDKLNVDILSEENYLGGETNKAIEMGADFNY